MSWSALRARPRRLRTAPLLNLAFVFLLLGYGTKAGLAPLHAWMPDAHAEGPTPVSAVLAGSILNVALTIILRLRGLLARQRAMRSRRVRRSWRSACSRCCWPRSACGGGGDVKRFFAFSTIEQSGVAAFAFGLGGAGGRVRRACCT